MGLTLLADHPAYFSLTYLEMLSFQGPSPIPSDCEIEGQLNIKVLFILSLLQLLTCNSVLQ